MGLKIIHCLVLKENDVSSKNCHKIPNSCKKIVLLQHESACILIQQDATTRDFIAYLKQEPLLKAILAGHEHITVQDRFSATADEYVVAGNFLFHGQVILFV